MDVMWAIDDPLYSTLQQLMDIPDEVEKAISTPSRAFARDRNAMARTPADVKELPNFYIFEVDMPGIGCGEIKVQVEDNLLVISGERRREDEPKREVQEDKEKKEKEKEKEVSGGAKYLRMERRMGKFLRKFPLPVDANTEAITAACKDGVLTVMVEKVPPPESKKPKTIQVQIA